MHDRTIRGTVKPFWRKKQALWFARGWVPERRQDGSITRRRIERGPGVTSKARCQDLCNQLNKFYEDRATAVRKPLTFAKAATNYMTSGGEARFLTDALLLKIGTMQCADIDDSVMSDLRNSLYPNGSPATVNRQLFTPVIAVLKMASDGKHCPPPALRRPKGHDDAKPIDIPPAGWFERILPECRPNLRALSLFLTLHGRRVKEALTRKPVDFDPLAGTISIMDTKTGVPVLVRLAPIVIEAIQSYDWQSREWLFGYSYRSRRNVLRDLELAAKRAGVPYYTTHPIGRHSFATRLLKQGFSVKHVADGGGWADGKMVMKRYGHLAKSEVSESVREVGISWGKELQKDPSAAIIRPDFKRKKRSGEKG
jgi:integrase